MSQPFFYSTTKRSQYEINENMFNAQSAVDNSQIYIYELEQHNIEQKYQEWAKHEANSDFIDQNRPIIESLSDYREYIEL